MTVYSMFINYSLSFRFDCSSRKVDNILMTSLKLDSDS